MPDPLALAHQRRTEAETLRRRGAELQAVVSESCAAELEDGLRDRGEEYYQSSVRPRKTATVRKACAAGFRGEQATPPYLCCVGMVGSKIEKWPATGRRSTERIDYDD